MHPAVSRHSELYPLLGEARSRFGQLQYLYDTVLRLQGKVVIASENAKLLAKQESYGHKEWRKFAKQYHKMGNRTVLHAEMFYVIAFREIEIVRIINLIVYGKKSFIKEPAGVRDARNHLIIHPEKVKPGPLFYMSASFDSDDKESFRLRSERFPGESKEFMDAGIGPNAREFRVFWIKWWQKLFSTFSDMQDS